MRHGILAGTPQTRCKALALGTTRAGMPCILLSNTRGLEYTTNLLSYGYTDHKSRYGMTALHRACQQSDATLVQLLLENDLNVDEQDVFQRCPLALSAWRNNALGVQYLLDSGADRVTREHLWCKSAAQSHTIRSCRCGTSTSRETNVMCLP